MANLDRCFVSGWSDDEDGIEPERNPSEENPKRILAAAENGKLDEVKALLKLDPTLVSSTDKEGYTPLHRACYGNHVEVVKYLLQNGADIAAKTEVQWQPLHSCCHWNNIECAQILLAEGADVNALSEGGQTPLHIAASHGVCYDLVQLLLMHPYIKPHLKNNSSETAFDIARRSSKYRNVFDMVDPLIDLKHIET
ncbi:ankyrin repeat domain-containing protein 49-like [Tribolium madens]|uniref:ankyrin repeat domain-containing protein 49-like n=1 Tax=Tribolium madens TaxID=41895 RepID=UPI001CF7580F|nr:ankyrin repeat domain-containing protein 49-like [Tribolium madens]